jgi:hypothetical protein
MILAIGLAFLAAAISFAGHHEIPEDHQVIKFEAKLGTVTFEHAAHAGYDGVNCVDCHHTWDEGGEAAPQPCSECHEEDAPKGADPMNYKDAMHDSCAGCHEKNKEAGKPSGPVEKACKECHVRG